MSGIKNLFHQYNQELMEFMQPPMQQQMPQPAPMPNPMMGYGGIPNYQMMQKPIKFPGMPTDPSKKKDDNDTFWKALLAAGAAAGLGGLGIYGYNKYQQHNSLGNQLGRLLGKQVGVHGDNALEVGGNLLADHISRRLQNAHQSNTVNDFFSNMNARFEEMKKNQKKSNKK